MAIDKQHVLDEIKRVAKAYGGKAPGKQKFTSETGIKESDWYPRHWLRWSDALRGIWPISERDGNGMDR